MRQGKEKLLRKDAKLDFLNSLAFSKVLISNTNKQLRRLKSEKKFQNLEAKTSALL